jgi:hypothetical protein
MFSFFRFISPLRGFRDLRAYLMTRQRYELWFLFASLVITVLVATVFIIDSNVEAPYRPPEIVYVQQWPANRTDAQIIAQQKIDGPKEQAAKDALAKAEAEHRAQFQRLDAKLKRWGI